MKSIIFRNLFRLKIYNYLYYNIVDNTYIIDFIYICRYGKTFKICRSLYVFKCPKLG